LPRPGKGASPLSGRERIRPRREENPAPGRERIRSPARRESGLQEDRDPGVARGDVCPT
jgi:hypothetical protein